MTKKGMFGIVVVGMLALAGCQHGMYAYEVSVYRNKNGISDYTVVDSLDVAEYPQSMPVVVKLTSMSQGTGGYDWRAAVSVLTLYTLPRIITSEMRQYDVTVKTAMWWSGRTIPGCPMMPLKARCATSSLRIS